MAATIPDLQVLLQRAGTRVMAEHRDAISRDLWIGAAQPRRSMPSYRPDGCIPQAGSSSLGNPYAVRAACLGFYPTSKCLSAVQLYQPKLSVESTSDIHRCRYLLFAAEPSLPVRLASPPGRFQPVSNIQPPKPNIHCAPSRFHRPARAQLCSGRHRPSLDYPSLYPLIC